MFDRADYPYTETFVREAIQNTLDARLDAGRPAIIRFGFHQAALSSRRAFLEGAVKFREIADFPPVEDWQNGQINWVTIEDFNTRGLDGSLDDRLGNFWNYWLNFGVSNKDGAKRGGRGIGRVTFLIASRMQTVLALTRRVDDGVTAACGMTLLRTMRTEGVVRTTHAYLADNEKDDVFGLHVAGDFNNGLAAAFSLNGYNSAPTNSGLALIIPYPHADLTPEGILASAVEHFAPAILNGSLVVQVDDVTLDKGSIEEVGVSVAEKFHTRSIRDDVRRYLDLIAIGMSATSELKVDSKSGLAALRDTDQIKAMQEACAAGKKIALKLSFSLKKNDVTLPVSLRAVLAKTPDDQLPIDRFFREGMSLPEVKSSMPGELDLVLLVDDENLATFLNLCEGKAHLDLLESKEVRAKLEKNGYHLPILLKRFIKGLPTELRALLTPDITQPEIDVFDAFFALPDDSSEKKKSKGAKADVSPAPPVPPPLPKISPIVMETLPDGFRVAANPSYGDWPVNVSVTMAYADGTRKPAWSIYDFALENLSPQIADCDANFSNNKLTARNCGPAFAVEVTGFDVLRELDTHIKVWKNAQND
ncbi:hypothetical protein [Mycoplana rhizolycopersici]|uniref:Uncharacterized protein n=1 Tax=Mycoplana rhizolycopersici TaxID=2746702 RepID=A0ABX2QAH5_9HYPH|nr:MULTISPECIES: hypothetical protein [Rhizobium/Agrobacterium group]NVP54729.1 hypothetical protein [Rhizobium rhizolycopersici]TQN56764.1 hypothetical protein FLX27_29510 [Agrobacterium tumefaciens]